MLYAVIDFSQSSFPTEDIIRCHCQHYYRNLRRQMISPNLPHDGTKERMQSSHLSPQCDCLGHSNWFYFFHFFLWFHGGQELKHFTTTAPQCLWSIKSSFKNFSTVTAKGENLPAIFSMNEIHSLTTKKPNEQTIPTTNQQPNTHLFVA